MAIRFFDILFSSCSDSAITFIGCNYGNSALHRGRRNIFLQKRIGKNKSNKTV